MNDFAREPHIPCPWCVAYYGERRGWIFQDARGGYECTECDKRFAIDRESPHGYGGPGGPLSWAERNAHWFERAGYLHAGLAGAALAEQHFTTAAVLFVLQVCFLLAARHWGRR